MDFFWVSNGLETQMFLDLKDLLSGIFECSSRVPKTVEKHCFIKVVEGPAANFSSWIQFHSFSRWGERDEWGRRWCLSDTRDVRQLNVGAVGPSLRFAPGSFCGARLSRSCWLWLRPAGGRHYVTVLLCNSPAAKLTGGLLFSCISIRVIFGFFCVFFMCFAHCVLQTNHWMHIVFLFSSSPSSPLVLIGMSHYAIGWRGLKVCWAGLQFGVTFCSTFKFAHIAPEQLSSRSPLRSQNIFTRSSLILTIIRSSPQLIHGWSVLFTAWPQYIAILETVVGYSNSWLERRLFIRWLLV